MSIAEGVETLRRGGLVAFPTETVYGLGCDAASTAGLERLYAVKRRPVDHPVIVHLGDAALALDGWAATVSEAGQALIAAFWPGPLTLVVGRGARVIDAVTGGRDTVGLRVPSHPMALQLLRAFGSGVAAPSANRFGRVSPTSAADVRADLGDDIDLVLDGGSSDVGVESTIVDCTGDDLAILRLGGVTREQIAETVGGAVALRTAGEVAAPGTLPAHYAPTARVVIVDRSAVGARATGLLAAGETVGIIAPGPPPPDLPVGVVTLASPDDDDEFARVLYPSLRAADRASLDVVLAILPAARGIGAAVADRLSRAAAS